MSKLLRIEVKAIYGYLVDVKIYEPSARWSPWHEPTVYPTAKGTASQHSWWTPPQGFEPLIEYLQRSSTDAMQFNPKSPNSRLTPAERSVTMSLEGDVG